MVDDFDKISVSESYRVLLRCEAVIRRVLGIYPSVETRNAFSEKRAISDVFRAAAKDLRDISDRLLADADEMDLNDDGVIGISKAYLAAQDALRATDSLREAAERYSSDTFSSVLAIGGFFEAVLSPSANAIVCNELRGYEFTPRRGPTD